MKLAFVNLNKTLIFYNKTKVIFIDNNYFTDWDEIYDDDIIKIININDDVKNVEDIHKYLDGGFCGLTKIKLKNGINNRNKKNIFCNTKKIIRIFNLLSLKMSIIFSFKRIV